jgi:nucleoside 2-deoxyribosyltransferase
MTSEVFLGSTGRAPGVGGFRVYLAGPMVFEPDPIAIFDRMKALCLAHGVVGVAPLDNQIGLEGIAPGKDLLERIVRADIALMDRLDAAVFCLDGFRRGPEMDAGTAFEVGYMKALGKPIAGWTRDIRLYPERVGDFFGQRLMPDTRHDVGVMASSPVAVDTSGPTLQSTAATGGPDTSCHDDLATDRDEFTVDHENSAMGHDDFRGRRPIPTRAGITRTEAGSVGGTSGLLRDPDGVLVHSEGCVQNAMVHVGIELAGGIVAVDADWERAFSLAVASVAAQLRARSVAAAVLPP